MVTYGHKTVREGERACIWSRDGSVRVVDGPKRVTLCFQRLELLHRHFASNTQYLEVIRKDGTVDIVEGPCAQYIDPVRDETIYVREARMIDASEALVVYRHGEQTTRKVGGNPSQNGGSVERRLVMGPARFIPRADEWIHHFEWSGMPAGGSKTTYQPKALKFTNLRVIPASAYHNVNEVRTNDDTLITVKLMLFFELDNIEKMLDATNDPIGDFINAASADVIAFCATLNYETFLNETHKLNELTTFAQLCARATHIGYRITKVVFRGFQAGEKLQAMHDGAIQERTRLRLLEQTEEQAQRQADMKLASETRRAAQQAELETGQAEQKAQLSMVSMRNRLAEKKLADDADAERQAAAREAALADMRAKAEAEHGVEQRRFELEKARNAETVSVMRQMKDLGVDLTKVLVSQHEQPDKVIKLDTGSAGSGADSEPTKSMMNALRLHI